MLFNIIFEILVLSILIMLFLCVFELYKKLNVSERVEVKPLKRLFRKPKETTKEEKRLNQILDNISNYNGSELGQKEIEVE